MVEKGEEKMSKSNICIVGLSKQFIDEVCRQLSNKLDMFYANVQEIIEFELMDLAKVEEICGVEYLLKEEKSIIRRVCTYENTLINIEYSSLNNESTLDIVKHNCLLIYLRLDSNRFIAEQNREALSDNIKLINQDVFSDRDFICNKVADLTIDCLNLRGQELETMIIEQILKYYS